MTLDAGTSYTVSDQTIQSQFGVSNYGVGCVVNQTNTTILAWLNTYGGNVLGGTWRAVPPGATVCEEAVGNFEWNWCVELANGGGYACDNPRNVGVSGAKVYLGVVDQNMLEQLVGNQQVNNNPSVPGDVSNYVYSRFYNVWQLQKLPDTYIQYSVSANATPVSQTYVVNPASLGLVSATTYVYPNGQTITVSSSGASGNIVVKASPSYAYVYRGTQYVKTVKNGDNMDPYMTGVWAYRQKFSGQRSRITAMVQVPYNETTWAFIPSDSFTRRVKIVDVPNVGVKVYGLGKPHLVHQTVTEAYGVGQYPSLGMNHFTSPAFINAYPYQLTNMSQYGYDGNNTAFGTVVLATHIPRTYSVSGESAKGLAVATGLGLLGLLAQAKK